MYSIGDLKFYGQGAGKLPTANAIVQDIIDIKLGVPRQDVAIKNNKSLDLSLLKHTFLLRSKNIIENEKIEKYDIYADNTYIKTKPITFLELEELVAQLKDENSSVLVAKFQ